MNFEQKACRRVGEFGSYPSGPRISFYTELIRVEQFRFGKRGGKQKTNPLQTMPGASVINYNPPSDPLFPITNPAAVRGSDKDPNGNPRDNQSKDCQDCSGGAQNSGDCNSSYSAHPVRYSSGEIRLVVKDLESEGFGLPWGHTRSYGNLVTPTNVGFNGNSWFVKEVPFLTQKSEVVGGVTYNYVVAIGTVNDAVWFRESAGSYAPRDYAKESLAHDAPNKRFILRFDLGQVMKFYDFDASHPAAKRGAFESFTDQAGRVVTASFGANNLISQFAQGTGGTTSTYEYAYFTSGTNIDRLQYVTLKVNGTNLRRAEYDYYDGTNSYGSAGDLRRARLQEWDGAAWVTRATHYYRYYKSGDTDGVVNGLKYVVSPLGYAALVAAGITPETATEAQISGNAVHAFKYNSDRSVKSEAVNGGAQNFDFTYGTPSTFANDPNNWKWKTIQSLPDGNQQTVYTNYMGLVILKVLQQMVSGSVVWQWGEYFQYDSLGRITLQTGSSGIDFASIDDESPGVVSLNDTTGLITTYEYYGSTPPTGGVTGYLQYQKVKQGSGGTPIKVAEWQYQTQQFPPSQDRRVLPKKNIVYQSDASGGSDAATTEFAYTWQGSTLQIDEMTITLPVVATTQNGSGTANSRKEKFDAYGRTIWKLDERGYITGYTYDLSTGGLTKVVEDASVSTPWTPVGGSHLNLTTDYTVDLLGRPTQALGPAHTIDVAGTATNIRRATWTVYKDDAFETWVGQGYQKTSDSSFTLINPVQITRRDAAARVTDEIGATRSSTSGKLQASDSLPQSGWISWSKNVYAGAPGLASTRSYFLMPATGEGTAGTNYNEQVFGYDNMRRRIRVVAADGTITRYVFNTPGWATEQWLGTDDTGATASNPAGPGGNSNNMSKVEASEYDGNVGGKDGNRTKLTRWEDASNKRETTYDYDYRNRLIKQDGELDFYEAYAYDNLDRLTQTERKNTTSSGTLVTRNETKYDPLGRVYQRLNYSVSGGTAGNSLKDKIWYGPSGLEIKRVVAGDRAFTKTQYDQVDRVSKVFQCFDTAEADTDYAAAGTVTSDTVVEQVESTWDDGGNVIQTVSRQRFDNATGTGELTTPGGSQPKARASYLASYPDAVGRTRAAADYGTNAAASFTRASTIPTRSDTVLVTSTEYDSAGRVWKVTDPKAIENQTEYDVAGRVTKTIENYVSGGTNPDQNRTTEMTYTALNQLKTLTAKNSVTGDQVTTWVYGVAKGAGSTDSDVARNDLLRAKEFPDKASSTDRVEYRYDRLGEVKEIKDQAGTIRTLQYDKLGRLQHDRVTTLASGVDGSIRRILRQYNVRGLLDKLTSYDNQDPNLGSIVNEVAYTYNGFGQVTYEYQSHSGSVGGGTPGVQYAYTDGSANHARRTSITYPTVGTVISLDYGSGTDDVLNRVKQLKNSTTVLVDYSYLGGQQVVIANSSGEPGVELTYYTSGGSGDAGDQYTGLDRFGRIIDQRWRKTSDNTDRERVKYGYDRASNRQWRQNTVAVTGQDEYYTYDGLSQVKTLDRGTLNGTFTGITGTPGWEEDWTYDPSGNWRGSSTGYLTKVAGSTALNQNRAHNLANEVTDITETAGVAWPTPTFDAPGNMTVAPRPLALGSSYDLKYDAWNRLIEVKVTGGSVLSTYQYDGAFRRVTKVTGGHTRHYFYSDQWQVLEERLDASTSSDRWFVWGVRSVDDLILRHRSSERLYALGDALNITAVVNTSGAVQERYGYTGFGNVRYMNASFGDISASAYDWETLFGAYRYDTESGLYNVRYRYLHSPLGRWISRDPLEYADSNSIYTYAINNPVIHYDSSGQSITEDECNAAKNAALRSGHYTKLILSLLKKTECPLPTITCTCCDESWGPAQYRTGDKEVVLCSNALPSGSLDNIIAHELTHRLQHCQGRLKDDCDSIACNEVQAACLSGQCDHINNGPQRQQCIKTAATFSLAAQGKCSNVAAAVAKALKSCCPPRQPKPPKVPPK